VPVDTLFRAISDDLSVRIIAATTTDLVREACARQSAHNTEAVVLTRAATCVALLATLAKEGKERVLLQLKGDGPIGSVVADAWGDGRVRACLERRLSPQTELARLQLGDDDDRPVVSEAIGTEGYLVVTRDLGLEQQYQGSVDLQNGEIDTDVERYLNLSEQLPSAITCACRLDGNGTVLRSAGVMVQGFPGADPERVDQIRARFSDAALRDLIRVERDPAELVTWAMGGERFDPMGETRLVFHCPCDVERVLGVLTTLGAEDLRALADEQPTTEVGCHFCGKVYEIPADQIRALADGVSAQRS